MTTPFKLTMKRVLIRCRAAADSGRLQATAVQDAPKDYIVQCRNRSVYKGKIVYCAIGSALPCAIRQQYPMAMVNNLIASGHIIVSDNHVEDMVALQDLHDTAARSRTPTAYNAFLTELVQLETKYNINIWA